MVKPNYTLNVFYFSGNLFHQGDMKTMLRELRESKGLSQEQLAEVLGWKQNYVSRYESGKIEMPLNKIVQAAKFFGVYTSTVLGEIPIGQKAAPDPKDDAFLDIIQLCLREWKKPIYANLPEKAVIGIAVSIFDQAHNLKEKEIAGRIASLMAYEAKRNIQ